MERVGQPVQKLSLRMADETKWRNELLSAGRIVPSIQPLAMLWITKECK